MVILEVTKLNVYRDILPIYCQYFFFLNQPSNLSFLRIANPSVIILFKSIQFESSQFQRNLYMCYSFTFLKRQN